MRKNVLPKTRTKAKHDSLKLEDEWRVVLFFISKSKRVRVFKGKKEVASIARDHFGFWRSKNYF
jgi:hypothetical protein